MTRKVHINKITHQFPELRYKLKKAIECDQCMGPGASGPN